MGGKAGTGADEIYASHIFGQYGQYNHNQGIARERAIYQEHMRNIGELAINRYTWTGFPESVDLRFMELCLYYTSLAVFYHDDTYDKDLVVRGSGTGYVNMLDNPVSFNVIGPGTLTNDATGPGMFNKTLSAYDPIRHNPKDAESKRKCIPIWGNAMRHPIMSTVRIYAQRLAWVDRTLEINTRNARRTKIIRGSAQTQLSKVNVARSMDQGDELIVVTDALMQDPTFLDTIDLQINPDSYDKLSIYRTRVWNELMGLLGIDNANQDKKERLVESEVGANDSQTDSFRYINLNAREQAAKQIKDVFGHDIKVEFRVEVEAEAKQLEQRSNPANNVTDIKDAS